MHLARAIGKLSWTVATLAAMGSLRTIWVILITVMILNCMFIIYLAWYDNNELEITLEDEVALVMRHTHGLKQHIAAVAA